MVKINYDKFIWENDSLPSKIKESEDVVFVAREDLSILGFKFLFLVVLFLILFAIKVFAGGIDNLFLLALFDTLIYSFSTGLLLSFTLSFHNYYLSIQFVTTERVIDVDQRGIFNREVNQILLDDIEDVSYKQKTLTSVIFNYGDVILQSSGNDNSGNPSVESKINGFVFNNVSDPKSVSLIVSRLVQNNQTTQLTEAAKYNAHFISEALKKHSQTISQSSQQHSSHSQTSVVSEFEKLS